MEHLGRPFAERLHSLVVYRHFGNALERRGERFAVFQDKLGPPEIIQARETLHQPVKGSPLILGREQGRKRILGPVDDADAPVEALSAKHGPHVLLGHRPAEGQRVPFPSVAGHKGKGHNGYGRRGIRSVYGDKGFRELVALIRIQERGDLTVRKHRHIHNADGNVRPCRGNQRRAFKAAVERRTGGNRHNHTPQQEKTDRFHSYLQIDDL